MFTNKLLQRAYTSTTHQQSTTKTRFDSDSFDVCIDSGASSTCTMAMSDFIPGTYKSLSGKSISGITSSLPIEGYGSVNWTFRDDNGTTFKIFLKKVLYIPALTCRLLSPQQLANQSPKKNIGFTIQSGTCKLTYDGRVCTITYNANSQLPMISTCTGINSFRAFNGTLVHDGTITDNLTYAQRQLLHWHRKLAHMDFVRIQDFARQGILPKELTSVRSSEFPVCAACQYGKQRKLSTPTESTGSNGLTFSVHSPGDCVSIDMIHSPIGGIIPVSKGLPKKEKYTVACVFVDHYSQLVFVQHQISTTAEETVQSKHAFERHAKTFGVEIKSYRADNNPFNSRVFRESCAATNQRIDFCGSYAHFQNGIAERMIQTLTTRARSMLLHAMFHWPDAITVELWPFTIRLVADIHNVSPRRNALSPTELFSSVK